MAIGIQIFDRSGGRLAEFNQDIKAEWLLNEPGECEFTFSAARELRRLAGRDLGKILDFGNLLWADVPKLGSWTGVISRQSWKSGIVTIRAKGALRLLGYATPETIRTIKGTAGSLFLEMLKLVSDQTDWKIRPGSVFTGGTQREETLDADALTDALRVAERAKHEVEVVGRIENGRLVLEGNWYERQGVDTPLVLAEGAKNNLALPGGSLLDVDGEYITNRVIGRPDVASKNKKEVVERDDASAGRYGPRWMDEVWTNVTEEGTLLEHVRAVLKQRKNPSRVVGLRLLDVGRTYDQSRIGNRARVVLYTAGFREGGALGTDMTGRMHGLRIDTKAKTLEAALVEDLV